MAASVYGQESMRQSSMCLLRSAVMTHTAHTTSSGGSMHGGKSLPNTRYNTLYNLWHDYVRCHLGAHDKIVTRPSDYFVEPPRPAWLKSSCRAVFNPRYIASFPQSTYYPEPTDHQSTTRLCTVGIRCNSHTIWALMQSHRHRWHAC